MQNRTVNAYAADANGANAAYACINFVMGLGGYALRALCVYSARVLCLRSCSEVRLTLAGAP